MNKWMIVFKDSEMGNAYFEEMKDAYDYLDKVKHSWNCSLYKLIEEF